MLLAGFEAAGFHGTAIIDKLLELDRSVYEGLSRLAGAQFDDFADLSAQLDTYTHSFWTGLSDPALDKVAGHVAEAIAAEQMTGAGVDVTWPGGSSQPGWDLLLNGHEVNIKLIGDADALADHFADYPEIPAIIPGDAVDIPGNVIRFNPVEGTNLEEALATIESEEPYTALVSEALEKADVLADVEDATDIALGTADVFDAPVPVLTFAFSGAREVSLLAAAHTNVVTAARNIGLDVAGVSAGGWAGAKLGAAVGGALGPIGALTAGLLGGIFGALFGRGMSGVIKESQLYRARDAHEDARNRLRARTAEIEREVRDRLDETRTQAAGRLRAEADKELAAVTDMFARLREMSEACNWFNDDTPIRLLDDAEATLTRLSANLEQRMRGRSLWRRILWPDVEILTLEEALTKAEAVRASVRSIRDSLLSSEPPSAWFVAEQLAKVGLAKGAIDRRLCAAFEERVELEKQLEAQVSSGRRRLARVRYECMTRLRDEVEAQREVISRELGTEVVAMEATLANLEAEARKLGRSVRTSESGGLINPQSSPELRARCRLGVEAKAKEWNEAFATLKQRTREKLQADIDAMASKMDAFWAERRKRGDS